VGQSLRTGRMRYIGDDQYHEEKDDNNTADEE